MDVALWFAGSCALLGAAAFATARARSRPDDVVGRAPFVAAAIVYAAIVAGAVWVWGGMQATAGHDDQLRRGARVALELRDVQVAPDATIGHDRAASVRLPGTGSPAIAKLAREARGVAVTNTSCAASAAFVLPIGATLPVADCGAPAFSLRAEPTRVALVPARPLRTTARAGEVLRIGRDDEPIPGLVAWEVPAASAELVAVPLDPTDCSAWPGAGRATKGGCELRIGAFDLAAVPIVADPHLVITRNARVAFALGAPVVLLCLVLACAPRSRRRAPALSHALRLAAIGAALAALACWRLAWAYRIDVLRDFAPAGARVADNELAAALLGATLAGLALRRWTWAIVAWAGALGLGWHVLGLGPAEMSSARTAMTGLSLLAVLAPRAPRPPLDALVARIARVKPELALVAIAGAAIAARVLAPRGVLVKLALAYALVLVGHAALRDALGGARRVRIGLALAAAALALAAYDTGVTVAIAGVGLALAMLVAAHDAFYDASRAGRIGILEREHARLVAVHGAVTVVVAVAAMAVAYVASDSAWLVHGADIACQAPLLAAALFAFGAVFAYAHRRAWLPHALAAIAALAVWGARGDVLERATAGHGVISDRVAAVVEPGYALLHDGHRFAATASAWREAAVHAEAIDRWHGEGMFGARIVDPGVVHSIENDYLPVLVARETGVSGIAQTTLLVLLLVVAAGVLASVARRHASAAHRGRWLVAMVLGTLAVYQPLASLGVLPLTGISWPGLGIDSPSDLWLFVIAIAWCALGREDSNTDDERVRGTPRVVRARRIAVAALASAACAGGIVVARSAAVALARVPTDDARIAAALDYSATVACPWREHDDANAYAVVPDAIGGTPVDAGTTRFDRELRAAWIADRPLVAAAIPACSGRVGHWRLARDHGTCTATFHAGGPELRLVVTKGWHATCAVASDDEPAAALRTRTHVQAPRIRVVAEALGAAAADAGEVIAGRSIIRLRAAAPTVELAAAPAGLSRAGSIALAPDERIESPGSAGARSDAQRRGVWIDVAARRITLHGDAALFTAGDAGQWRKVVHARDVALDRLSLIVAGPAEHRVIVQVRPGAEPLLADDVDRGRRTYAYGAALPELGWLNRFDVDHSLGLDGWIHVALAHPAKQPAACGTLAPPLVNRDRVCAPSALDGVLECRVALQPELALALTAVADKLAASSTVTPTRIGYVVMRGDTGELLAQASRVPGREPLAYAPVDREADAALIALREQHGESDRERVEWNLPIAVGSTFKAIVARAAEIAFPRELHALTLTATGHGGGCKAHRGVAVDPLLGHCPPTTLTGDGEPTTADVHDFLARSPNWFQAALGVMGLALPSATMSIGDSASKASGGANSRGPGGGTAGPTGGGPTATHSARPIAFSDVASSDLTSWPTTKPLQIDDATGPIIRGHSLYLDGLQRAPLWTNISALLGRPLCTLGNRAACERAADRADVCAARALPIDAPTRDLRYLVALGPDRVDLYDGDKPDQQHVPLREYFQLLRGSGAHPIGSLPQLADAFSRVVYDPHVAASWFPSPPVGAVPTWSCSDSSNRANTVLGGNGGLCAVVREGTAHAALAAMLADKRVVIYGAKTGTTDSLAELARRPLACAAWNASHSHALQLACGKRPPDDSLFVIAFGVVTPHGTIPITLALQLQRGGSGAAARATPQLIDAIARYLRAE